jgi:hypothetical protein
MGETTIHDPMLPPGTRYCLCRECGRYFGGETGFTFHRQGMTCCTDDTLINDGYRLNERGYWVKPLAGRLPWPALDTQGPGA